MNSRQKRIKTLSGFTDEERLDWLSKQFGCGLINDDNGHWAVAFIGTQNVPMTTKPCDINTTFWIKKKEWRNTIRGAIDAARKESGE